METSSHGDRIRGRECECEFRGRNSFKGGRM